MSDTDPFAANLISPYCPPAVIGRACEVHRPKAGEELLSASSSSDRPSISHLWGMHISSFKTLGLRLERCHPNLSCAYVRTITRMMVIPSPSPAPT